jgi:uncharacterized protein YndB with AHSA1/START domain
VVPEPARETSAEVRVRAALSSVWDLVTDIELPARFSPELRRVRWLDGAVRPVLGARFEGHNHNQVLGEWRTVSYVVELAAPRVFGWAVVDPDGRFGDVGPGPEAPMATWRFELAPEADGVRVRLGVRIGPARSGLSLAIDRMPDREAVIIQRRLADLRTGIQATLAGIRSMAERNPPPDR